MGEKLNVLARLAAGVLALAVLAGGQPAAAQVDKDYRQVIAVAQYQRMAIQKISKELMMVALEIDKADNLKQLQTSRADFDRVLWSLRDGDPQLNLPPTTEPEILPLLTEVEDLWPPFDDAIMKSIMVGEVTGPQIDAMVEVNLDLTNAMEAAAGGYLDVAGRKTLFSIKAKWLAAAGEQRMLTQRLAKEYFMLAYGYDEANTRVKLTDSSQLFERTLDGLIGGDPELRLLPAPTPEIQVGLRQVKQLWSELRPLVQAASTGKRPNKEQVTVMVRLNRDLLQHTHQVVQLFSLL